MVTCAFDCAKDLMRCMVVIARYVTCCIQETQLWKESYSA